MKFGQSEQGGQNYPIKGKGKKRLAIFAIFFIILLALAYFAFLRDGSLSDLTGRVISFGNNELKPEENIMIKAELLSSPKQELSSKADMEKLVIKSDQAKGNIYAGEEKFDLNNLNSIEIIISGYSGKLSFDSEKILNLDGEAAKISINGINTAPRSGDEFDISIEESFNYNVLEVDNLFLEPVSYKTSGTIVLNRGKSTINLDEETISLGEFQGSLKKNSDEFILEGYTEKVDIKGDLEISAKLFEE
jgi:hypothetical protein